MLAQQASKNISEVSSDKDVELDDHELVSDKQKDDSVKTYIEE